MELSPHLFYDGGQIKYISLFHWYPNSCTTQAQKQERPFPVSTKLPGARGGGFPWLIEKEADWLLQPRSQSDNFGMNRNAWPCLPNGWISGLLLWLNGNTLLQLLLKTSWKAWNQEWGGLYSMYINACGFGMRFSTRTCTLNGQVTSEYQPLSSHLRPLFNQQKCS